MNNYRISYNEKRFPFVFRYLWHYNFMDELFSSERWNTRTISLLLTTDTVKALAKLLHKVICLEESCYLRNSSSQVAYQGCAVLLPRPRAGILA